MHSNAHSSAKQVFFSMATTLLRNSAKIFSLPLLSQGKNSCEFRSAFIFILRQQSLLCCIAQSCADNHFLKLSIYTRLPFFSMSSLGGFHVAQVGGLFVCSVCALSFFVFVCGYPCLLQSATYSVCCAWREVKCLEPLFESVLHC